MMPEQVMAVLDTLRRNGFEAYLVGGCIRGLISGTPPHDWDIATDALPEQGMALFRNAKPTGVKYGTFTVGTIEVTAYRTESGYTDGRRPDAVGFGASLREDLARRDFTVGAMAYHPDEGLVDPFDGAKDWDAKILRCVGNPADRFNEDALRILRGVRFIATLGLTAEPATDAALRAAKHLLRNVSRERIGQEVCKTIMGNYAGAAVEWYGDVIGAAVGCPVVWREGLPRDLAYRLSVLLTDPACLDRLRLSRAVTRKAMRYHGGERYGALSVKDLAVKGDHLLAMGIPPGPFIGQTLQKLLHVVQQNKCDNNLQELLAFARKIITINS